MRPADTPDSTKAVSRKTRPSIAPAGVAIRTRPSSSRARSSGSAMAPGASGSGDSPPARSGASAPRSMRPSRTASRHSTSLTTSSSARACRSEASDQRRAISPIRSSGAGPSLTSVTRMPPRPGADTASDTGSTPSSRSASRTRPSSQAGSHSWSAAHPPSTRTSAAAPPSAHTRRGERIDMRADRRSSRRRTEAWGPVTGDLASRVAPAYKVRVRYPLLARLVAFVVSLFLSAVPLLAAPQPAAAAGKKALLIGINEYVAVPDLRGAVNDIELIRDVLITRYGFAAEDVEMITNEQGTRDAMLAALDRLAERTQPGDFV